MGTQTAETPTPLPGAFASELRSLAHSVYHLDQIGHMASDHRGPVLLKLGVPLRKVGLSAHLGEVSADSLALGHCRPHKEQQVLQVLVAHHNWTDDTLGRWAGSAQMVEQVELIG